MKFYVVEHLKKVYLVISILCITANLLAQDFPYRISQYDFVRYEKNFITFPGDSSNFFGLYEKLDNLIFKGKGQINVVHMGGSHIQAGALSGHMAQRLQTFYPGLKGSRGFVFPYHIARQNNPRNFYAKVHGHWEPCRSVQRRKGCLLGLSGISGTTNSANAKMNIYLQDAGYPEYEFNQVKVFHKIDTTSFDLKVNNIKNYTITTNKASGYSLITLDRFTDSLELHFEKSSEHQNHFTLFGISLESSEPGITYHGIGINGASIPCYLRCDLFETHLQGLSPDWIILTLGTNDAYGRNFDPDYFEANYDSLILRIKKAAPDAAILLTVPNDSYLYRRYVNRNTAKAGKVIKQIAEKHNCGVWDFYNIMGGLNSVALWYKDHLAQYDRIHFTRRGYHLQADLLFNAFLHAYDNYLDKNSELIGKNQ